jgi:hypothetical protein
MRLKGDDIILIHRIPVIVVIIVNVFSLDNSFDYLVQNKIYKRNSECSECSL